MSQWSKLQIIIKECANILYANLKLKKKNMIFNRKLKKNQSIYICSQSSYCNYLIYLRVKAMDRSIYVGLSFLHGKYAHAQIIYFPMLLRGVGVGFNTLNYLYCNSHIKLHTPEKYIQCQPSEKRKIHRETRKRQKYEN